MQLIVIDLSFRLKTLVKAIIEAVLFFMDGLMFILVFHVSVFCTFIFICF